MSEVKRKPVTIAIDDVTYEAFDEAHTLADVARWVMENGVDAEELHRILGEMLDNQASRDAPPQP